MACCVLFLVCNTHALSSFAMPRPNLSACKNRHRFMCTNFSPNFWTKTSLIFTIDFILALLPTVCKHKCTTKKWILTFAKLLDDVITFAHQCVSYSFGAPRNSAPFQGFVLFCFLFFSRPWYQPFAGTSVVGSMKTLIRRNIAQLITKTTKPLWKIISKACLPLAL